MSLLQWHHQILLRQLNPSSSGLALYKILALLIHAFNQCAEFDMENGIASSLCVLGAHFKYSKPPPAFNLGKAIVM